MCLLRQCFFLQNLYSFNATGYVIVSILTFISLNHYQVMRVVKIYHVSSMCKTYNKLSSRIVVVQLLSCVQLFAIPWMVPHQAFLSFTISQSLFKFTSVELVILSNHLIFCCPLLLCLQSFSASTSFPMSWFFPSGNQRIGASASVLSMTIQG